MKVIIELEFDNEPTKEDVYNYIDQLIWDESLEYTIEEQRNEISGKS